MRIICNTVFYGALVLLLSACAIGTNEDVDDSNWKETYATLYRYGYGRGAVSMIFYWVDGKRYEVNGTFNAKGKVIGDKYLIKYNPQNPEQIKEYLWYVVFLTTEKTEETIGTVKEVWSKNLLFNTDEDIGITFVYFANKKEYRRTQLLQPNYEQEYPNLKVGQKYKVLYWVENPQRAVLYLDSLVSE